MVVGSTAEIDDLCRAIRRRGDGPDFIAVDGNEGGSGAAPLALADYLAYRARLSIFNRLHPGAPLPYEHLPDRGHDAESVAPVWPRPHGQGVRVRNYALALERDLQMIIHACGLTHPGQLHRGHVIMNISPGVRKSLVDLFPYPAAGQRAASRERAFQLETLVSK
jgi:hypothetical protein